MAHETNPPGLKGQWTPAGIYYPLKHHSVKEHHVQALAYSVDDALADISVDSGNLPPGGEEGQVIIIGPDGKPIWGDLPDAPSGGGGISCPETYEAWRACEGGDSGGTGPDVAALEARIAELESRHVGDWQNHTGVDNGRN